MAASASFPSRIEDVDLVKTLGKGFFGEVYRAEEKGGSKRTFAVKKIRRALVAEHKLEEQIKREMTIMYSLTHPRIVKLFCNFEDSKYLYLAMEYVTGGSLFDRLNRARKFSPDVASRYFAETCDALDYLHHLPEKVTHRDIKPENILLDGADQVKLADFGWANLLEGSARNTFCGTLDYLAPEMIQGSGHDESVDMWNMGVLLFELTTGESPFGSTSKESTCRAILNVDLHFPANLESDARDLISGLCKKLPKERLEVREALAHPFVMKRRGQSAAPVSPAVDEEDAEGRPSVVVRRLRDERTKVNAEMQCLLQAKQRTEDSWLTVNTELDATHKMLQKERKERAKLEAGCADLKKSIAAREVELEKERARLAALQGERSKVDDKNARSLQGSIFNRVARA